MVKVAKLELLTYVYELKATLLLKISETSKGADCLVEHGIFEVLSECQFLDQNDTMEPSLIENYRFNDLQTITLLLVGSLTIEMTKIKKEKLLKFVKAHQNTFLSILIQPPLFATLTVKKLLTRILQLLGPTKVFTQPLINALGQFTKHWYKALEPVTELEQIKYQTVENGSNQFYIEAQDQGAEICQNIIYTFKGN
jgi:hypothetical protein